MSVITFPVLSFLSFWSTVDVSNLSKTSSWNFRSQIGFISFLPEFLLCETLLMARAERMFSKNLIFFYHIMPMLLLPMLGVLDSALEHSCGEVLKTYHIEDTSFNVIYSALRGIKFYKFRSNWKCELVLKLEDQMNMFGIYYRPYKTNLTEWLELSRIRNAVKLERKKYCETFLTPLIIESNGISLSILYRPWKTKASIFK